MWLLRALVHANSRARCDGLSNANAKCRQAHKTAGFAWENTGKIKSLNPPMVESWRNLRSGEKFHQACRWWGEAADEPFFE
jgi:hypothetical protein